MDHYCTWLQRYRIQKDSDMSHWQYEGFHRKQEIFAYVLPLLFYDYVNPRRKLPASAPSFVRLVAEVIACLLVYDFLFFFVHVACHKIPQLYRHIHRKHHTKKIQRITEALRLTLAEEFLDVTCSIAAVNLTGAHPLSRSIYNIIIVYLVIELHCGYDFPWMLQNVVPGDIWAGSRRHEAHHRTGRHYYQKFFTYLDDLFGFVEPHNRRFLNFGLLNKVL